MNLQLVRAVVTRGRRSAALALLLVAALVSASSAGSPSGAEADPATVAAVVDRYHRALSDGDTLTALALLATDAIILESGDVETREEYRSHHLAADIAFARAVPSLRAPVRVVTQGDVAWTTSTATTRGTYGGRAIDSQGAELMVLTKGQDGWRIRAVHWSSHPLRPSR